MEANTFRVAIPIPLFGEMWDITTDLVHMFTGIAIPGYNNAAGASDVRDIAIDIDVMFRRYFVLSLVVAVLALWQPLIRPAMTKLLNPAPAAPGAPVIAPVLSQPAPTSTVAPTAEPTIAPTATPVPMDWKLVEVPAGNIFAVWTEGEALCILEGFAGGGTTWCRDDHGVWTSRPAIEAEWILGASHSDGRIQTSPNTYCVWTEKIRLFAFGTELMVPEEITKCGGSTILAGQIYVAGQKNRLWQANIKNLP